MTLGSLDLAYVLCGEWVISEDAMSKKDTHICHETIDDKIILFMIMRHKYLFLDMRAIIKTI